MKDEENPTRNQRESIHKDELLVLLEKTIESLNWIEPLIRDGAKVLESQRTWIDRFLGRNKSDGVQSLIRIREAYCGMHNKIAASTKPDPMVDCQVYILETAKDWVEYVDALKKRKSPSIGPYR